VSKTQRYITICCAAAVSGIVVGSMLGVGDYLLFDFGGAYSVDLVDAGGNPKKFEVQIPGSSFSLEKLATAMAWGVVLGPLGALLMALLGLDISIPNRKLLVSICWAIAGFAILLILGLIGSNGPVALARLAAIGACAGGLFGFFCGLIASGISHILIRKSLAASDPP
jgi:hypothetical protein